MKWEILYKRTKTGAIVYYDICTVPQTDGSCTILKESGQLGTDKPLPYVENIRQGKNLGKSNATTPQQQAELQAASDWKRKKDEGYKSLEDLNITTGPNASNTGILYFYTDNGVRAQASDISFPLEARLSKFNTDAQGNVKPMLAIDWKNVKTIQYPVYIQPKLDGVRCLMVVNEPEVTFLSRSGKTYTTLGHIANDVFEAYAEGKLQGNFILDGEIYSDEITFQEITQAVKKQYPNSLKLHFRAYDVVNEAIQAARIPEWVELVHRINSSYIHPVPTHEVYNSTQVMDWHNDFVKHGYEGAMLRLPEGKYEQGHRSRSLLKVKEFDEAEFPFVRWKQGQREEDLIAVLLTDDGEEFCAKMMGNRKQKEAMYELDIKPKEITVKFFGRTDDGLPRFPIAKTIRDYE